MLLVFSIYDRIELLPYFLGYYSSIGATRFECALYKGTKSKFYGAIVAFKDNYNLHVRMSVDCEFEKYRGKLIIPILNKIIHDRASQFPWYCVADLDEFHYFGGTKLDEVVMKAEAHSYDAVHGRLLDRIAVDGKIVGLEKPLDATYPLACNLSELSGVCCDKIVVARSSVPISDGGHHAVSLEHVRIWWNAAEVHHFKWTNGANEAVENRYKRARAQRLPWSSGYAIQMAQIKNGIDLVNPKLKVYFASKIGI